MASGRRLAAVVVGSIGLACGAFSTTEGPSPSAGDAGTSPETGSSSGGLDGSTTLPDGKVPPGCASAKHTFCDDFENGALGFGWDDVTVGAPAFLELVPSKGVSGSRALVARFDAFDAGFVHASLTKQLGQPMTSITCRTKLYIETLGASPEPTILMLAVKMAAGAPVPNSEIHLSMNSNGTNLALFQTGQDAAYGTALPLSVTTWLDLAISLDVESGRVDVTLGGSVMMIKKFPVAPKPNNGATFKMGLFDIAGGAKDGSVRFDDASCDLAAN